MKNLVLKIISIIFILFLYSCASNQIVNKDIEYIDLSKKVKKVKSAKILLLKETVKDKDKLNRIKEKKRLKLAKANSKTKNNFNKKKIIPNEKKNIKQKTKPKKIPKSKTTKYAKAEIIDFEKNFSYDEYKNLLIEKYENKKYPDLNN